ncbi:MAG: FGGY-family carbohydrate kinase [Desulfobacterales bacterium]
MSKTTTQDHLIRSVMEGVAYNIRWSLKYVEKFIHRALTPIHFIGGGAQSDTWCRIFADVLNREIRQIEDPRQANARGASFIASAGLGYITFDDIPKLTRIRKTFQPDPAHRKIYDDLYNVFIRLYQKQIPVPTVEPRIKILRHRYSPFQIDKIKIDITIKNYSSKVFRCQCTDVRSVDRS